MKSLMFDVVLIWVWVTESVVMSALDLLVLFCNCCYICGEQVPASCTTWTGTTPAVCTLTLDSTTNYRTTPSVSRVRSTWLAQTPLSGSIITSTKVAGSWPTASPMSTSWSTPSPATLPAMTLRPPSPTGLSRPRIRLSMEWLCHAPVSDMIDQSIN